MSWQKWWLCARGAAAILLGFSLSCQRGAPTEGSGEHTAPKGAASAHEEPEHGHEALPHRVKVSPEVVQSAGIQVERVAKATLVETLDLPGEVGADPDRMARLSSPAAGRIEAVNFREGAAVKKGEALIVIRVPELAKVRASQQTSQAKAKAARANAVRQRALVSERLAMEQEALNAEAEADALDMEARSAGEQLGALGAGASGVLTLRAPISGTVVARNAVVGQPASMDQVLGTVADLSQVWFLARVFEKDLGQLRAGASAEVHLNAYADEHFSGVVDYISQQIDPVARTVTARVRVENRNELLRLGLFGTCQISTGKSQKLEPKLVVPRSSVTEVAGKLVVFVRESPGEFELHQVTLGRESLGKVEVLEGLREGEEIVSDGAFTLKSLVLKGSFAEDE